MPSTLYPAFPSLPCSHGQGACALPPVLPPQLGVSSLARTRTPQTPPSPQVKQAEEKRVLTCQRHDLPSSSGREAEDCLLCLLQRSSRTRDHLALLAGKSQGVRL